MNRCSGCGYILPGSWNECRRCGTPIAVTTRPGGSNAAVIGALALAPPPPPTPLPGARARAEASGLGEAGFGAPDDALLPGAPKRDTGPDTMLPHIEPTIITAPKPQPRVNGRTAVVGVVVVACVIGAAFSIIPHGRHPAAGPVILAPRAPSAGIPTSLSAIVRIAAESSRHTALSVVISGAGPSGAPLTIAQLSGLQPGYQWVLGTVPSTTNTMISVTSGPGRDTVAVSGTNREICAYGRWSPAAGSTYVTMDHVATCNAISAPATGWSTEPGGSAQDLPDETGL